MRRLEDFPAGWFFAVALVATSATQLRAADQPIGLGEVMMAVWLAWAIAAFQWRHAGHRPPGHAAGYVAAFWAFVFTAMSAGYVHSEMAHTGPDVPAGRDFIAFGLACAICIVVGVILRTRGDAEILLARYVITATLLLGALLVIGLVFRGIGPFKLWYQLVRFTGLGSNPNQLALFVAPIPLVAVQLARDRVAQPAMMWACGIAAAAIGIATASDALALAWIICLLLAMLGIAARSLRGRARTLGGLMASWVVAPSILAGGLIALAEPLYEAATRKATSVMQSGAQASVRETLWANGLEAFSRSPWVGWGPGAFSGLERPFSGTEAHNSYIDWATNTGLAGLALTGAALGALLWACIRAGKPWIALAIVSLGTFAFFHLVFRQPVFWVMLVLILVYASASNTRPGSPDV